MFPSHDLIRRAEEAVDNAKLQREAAARIDADNSVLLDITLSRYNSVVAGTNKDFTVENAKALYDAASTKWSAGRAELTRLNEEVKKAEEELRKAQTDNPAENLAKTEDDWEVQKGRKMFANLRERQRLEKIRERLIRKGLSKDPAGDAIKFSDKTEQEQQEIIKKEAAKLSYAQLDQSDKIRQGTPGS